MNKPAQQLAIVLLFLLLVLGCSERGETTPVEQGGLRMAGTDSISTLLKRLRTDEGDERLSAVEELVSAIEDHPDRQELKFVVPELTSLLQDKSDSIRYWTAMSLGKMGPTAIDAVPELLTALADKADEYSSKSSESGIRYALDEISPNWKTRDDVPQSVADRWGAD